MLYRPHVSFQCSLTGYMFSFMWKLFLIYYHLLPESRDLQSTESIKNGLTAFVSK